MEDVYILSFFGLPYMLKVLMMIGIFLKNMKLIENILEEFLLDSFIQTFYLGIKRRIFWKKIKKKKKKIKAMKMIKNIEEEEKITKKNRNKYLVFIYFRPNPQSPMIIPHFN